MRISLAKYEEGKERASKIADEISRTAALSALEIMWLRQSFLEHQQMANQYKLMSQEDPTEKKGDIHRTAMVHILESIMEYNEKLHPYMGSHSEIYLHLKEFSSLAEAVYSQIVESTIEDKK